MIQVVMKPELHKFETCREFAEALALNENDLVLTNKYIYEPFFGELGLRVRTVYQESYGSGEPSDVMTESIIKDIKDFNFKRIIAIGGGTIIDIAKALAVADKGESMDELYSRMPNLTKHYELIIVPTTCGTGSEMTNIAVFNRTRLGTKMGLVGPAMYAEKAVLIPELLYNLPYGVFATSSIDALVHAVESILSPKATVYTKTFAYKAVEMIIKGYQKLAKDGREALQPLLGDFLVASNLAGIAFGTAGCGLVHAMAYPLGSQFHIAHGESNYVIFLGVMKKYMQLCQSGEIAVLNKFLAELLNCKEAVAFDELETLLNHILPHKPLNEYGVKSESLPEFTANVMQNQGRLLANAFVEATYEMVLDIYTELY